MHQPIHHAYLKNIYIVIKHNLLPEILYGIFIFNCNWLNITFRSYTSMYY